MGVSLLEMLNRYYGEHLEKIQGIDRDGELVETLKSYSNGTPIDLLRFSKQCVCVCVCIYIYIITIYK